MSSPTRSDSFKHIPHSPMYQDSQASSQPLSRRSSVFSDLMTLFRKSTTSRRRSVYRPPPRRKSTAATLEQGLLLSKGDELAQNDDEEDDETSKKPMTRQLLLSKIREKKEVINNLRCKPWSMNRKRRTLRLAQKYLEQHENKVSTGHLYKEELSKKWHQIVRWGSNINTYLIPWESKIKKIENDNEKCQKKTFTKWINYHLETHSSSGQITNLCTDLRDGVFLCHLIEVLTGDALVSIIPDFNVNEAVANNESALIEVVERFRSLGALLHQEKALWKEFEATCKELESELILCQTEKRSPRFDCRQKLRDAQELAEKITGLLKSTAAGLSLKQRLKGLEQRLDKIDPPKLSVAQSSKTAEETERTVRTAKIHVKSGGMDVENATWRLNGFIKRAQGFLRKRPNNRQDLADLVAELEDCSTSTAEYDHLLEQCLESGALSEHEAELLSRSYRQAKQNLEEKLDKLRELQPIVAFVETKLRAMEHWTQFHDPSSELAKLSVKERADLVDQLGSELAILERPENKGIVNTSQLKELQQEISSLFV
uniref:Calponin-homology (CH) domain-containing protein n=1 Tax=Bursaphelenchus xylophilus TaxID=6326 RepID=A0A1I7SFY6_BURXY